MYSTPAGVRPRALQREQRVETAKAPICGEVTFAHQAQDSFALGCMIGEIYAGRPLSPPRHYVVIFGTWKHTMQNAVATASAVSMSKQCLGDMAAMTPIMLVVKITAI